MKTKICIACGMPMKDKADFAMGDTAKDYCIHCAKEDGTMHSFAEKKAGFIQLLIKTQGIDENKAEETALNLMQKLPAWQSHFQQQ